MTRQDSARPASRKPDILCVGYDDVLLETRRMVLESNDYAVQLTHPPDFLAPGTTFDFDLAIVCHSVLREQKRRVVHKLQKDYPGTLILLLNGPEYDPLPLSEEISSFSTIFSGPQALLLRVEGLINGKAGGNVAGKIGAGPHH